MAAGDFVDTAPPQPGDFVDAPAPTGHPNNNAQAQMRNTQQAASVAKAHATIAADPTRLSIGAQITGRPQAVTDPFAAHTTPAMTQYSPQAMSALNRIGTATSLFTMGANAGARTMAGDKNIGSQTKAIVTQGGLFGDVGKKLDGLGQLLGAGGPGEMDFWTAQPGVHDAIMGAHTATAGGAVAQLMIGMHSDFARWKQGDSLFQHVVSAGSTLGVGLVDPTSAVVGAFGAKLIGGIAKIGSELGEAAAGAARTTEAAKLPELATPETHTSTVREGAHTTTTSVTPPTPPAPPRGGVSPFARAGAALGRTFPNQVKDLGSGFKGLSRYMTDDMPIVGDRYAAMSREYGSEGEFVHSAMVFNHAQVPVTSATKVLSNDLFGGLSSDQKMDVVHGIEDLPNTSSGKSQVPPNRQVPVRGVSTQQRSENWSDMQMEKFARWSKSMPVTSKHLMAPKTYGHYEEGFNEPFQGPNNPNQNKLGSEQAPSPVYGAAPHHDPTPGTTVTPLQVADWFPRTAPGGKTPFTREGAAPSVSTGGYGMNGPNIKRRMQPSLAKQMKPQLTRDFTGQVTGRRPGREPNPEWDPAQAAVHKDIVMEQYHTMLEHVRAGKTLVSKITGRPATMDVTFHWPGGENWRGASIQHNGVEHDLSQPLRIGVGKSAAADAGKFADQVAPFWANKNGILETDARSRVVNRMTSGFFKENPTHIVNAGGLLKTPDIDGLAVEGTFLRSVADANPALKWLGTSQSVASRIPEASGELTHFQSMKAFPSGTVSGVSPSDMQQLHFRGTEDDAMPQGGFLRAFDMMTSAIKVGKLFAVGYHNLFNVQPAMLNLALDHAGPNPVKIAHYTTLLDSALLGGVAPTLREGISTAKSLLKGGNLMGHQSEIGAKFDVPSAWLQNAEKYHVTAAGAYGTGLPIDQYVHLFSSPMSELNPGEQVQRVIAAGSQWNQNMTFNTLEARQVATMFHILTEHENIAPEVASRVVKKSINDYSNLTPAEREHGQIINRLYWFYSFKKMMLRQAATSLLKRANVLGTESRVVQNWNQQQGDPQAGDRAIVLGKTGDGGFHVMSTSMAPYRYGADLAALSGGGGAHDAGKAAWALATGTLSPVADLVARGLAQFSNEATNTSKTPQPWDFRTGVADTKQPIDIKIQQALGLAANDLGPVPMGVTPSQFTEQSPKQYGQMSLAAMNLRNMTRYMNPEQLRIAMGLAQRLDNGDLTALGQATNMYSQIEVARKPFKY